MKKTLCVMLSFLLLIGFAFSYQAEAATTSVKSNDSAAYDDEDTATPAPAAPAPAASAAPAPAAAGQPPTDLAKATQVLRALSTGSEDEVKNRMESLRRLSQVLQTKQQIQSGQAPQQETAKK